MNQTTAKGDIRYVATVTGTREVNLAGRADLGYWTDRLGREDLLPYEIEGRAELGVGAVESGWMGIRFRELLVWVFTSNRSDGSSRDGLFLIGAFNSFGPFAWVERALFQTPYLKAEIELEVDTPVSFRVADRGRLLLCGEGRIGQCEPVRIDHHWEGPIYLPSGDGRARPRQVFFASMDGPREIWPFDPIKHVLAVAPPPGHPAVDSLRDSGFEAREWQICRDARHRRSKTYPRNPERQVLAQELTP